MSIAYSLDDVARTSDDAAVRARFDRASLTALRVISASFTVAALPHLAEAKTTAQVILGAIVFALGALTFVLVRKRAANAVARFVRRRARAAAIAFMLIEGSCLVVFDASADSQAAAAFAVMVPLAAILLRLLVPEHVLLHATFLAIVTLTFFTTPLGNHGMAPLLVPTALTNAGALVAALWISRRYKRAVIAEWSERRNSAREQIRMRDELRYARELQLSMLPECAPSLDWADICSISIPATEVGGDYYDYFVDGDSVALVSLDVAGHGMASGLVLSSVRGAITVLRDALHEPATVLQRLHDLVAHTTRRRMLVTISVVLIDHRTRRAVIASAGHPPVMVRRADGSVETINLYAPPLGVRLPLAVPQREIAYAPGDVFVLHSDGIYETRNVAGEAYGLERLRTVIAEHGGAKAEPLRDAILADVAAFRGAAEPDDDVTVVVCKINDE